MLALLTLGIWAYLFVGHWQILVVHAGVGSGRSGGGPGCRCCRSRADEAETIGRVVESLLAQEYAGRFRVILVDDALSDGTAELARAAVPAGSAGTLEVLAGRPKPDGWSGKLWAVSQGIEVTDAPVLLLTDADIVHDPRGIWQRSWRD